MEIVKLLIKKGAEIDAAYGGDETPLWAAARYDQVAVAEFLIAKGAEVDAKNKYGETPLHFAATNDHKVVAELLIAKGADINAKDNSGLTPLDIANRSVEEYKRKLDAGESEFITFVGDLMEVAKLLRARGGKTGVELKTEKRRK